MLSVLGIWWLAGAGAVGIVGAWMLWRGRYYRRPVSSVRLWAGLVGEASGSKARAIDPVWAVILAAGVLALLSAAGIRLRTQRADDRPWADCDVAMRAAEGSPTAQIWLRVRDAGRLPEPCLVRLVHGEKTEERAVSLADLRAGWVGDVPRVDRGTLELRIPGTDEPVARAEVRPMGGWTFGVVTVGRVDQALQRVVELQPGALRGDPGAGPVVWLVDDPEFAVDRVRPAGGGEGMRGGMSGGVRGGWVVASPRTVLPGVKLRDAASQPAGPSTQPILRPKVVAGSALFNSVRTGPGGELGDVTVQRFRDAELSPEWTVLATVEGRPWLATRRDAATGVGYLWMANRMAPAETNWPVDVSFVVFFTNLIGEMQRGEKKGAAAGLEAEEWAVVGVDGTIAREASYLDLTRWLALAAAGLAVAGMGLLVRRGRG